MPQSKDGYPIMKRRDYIKKHHPEHLEEYDEIIEGNSRNLNLIDRLLNK